MTNLLDLREKLAEYIGSASGQQAAITGMTPLAGGASRDTWLLDVTLDGQPQRFVIRRDLPTQMFEEALTREQEFLLMRRARENGVQAAQVRWLCTDPAVLGGAFFIMDYVPGISIGPRVIRLPELAAARQRLPEQIAEQLALIHRMDVTGLDFLARPQGETRTDQVIRQSYEVLDALGIHSPAWEWALRWAARHAPQIEQLTFVHGDVRVGNLLVDENGLTAVIDWEFGHIGDPLEELGYPCMRDWRFGNGHLHFAGLCDRERFLQAYEQYSGRSVDRQAVDWWEIMGSIRWGIICMSQANRHLSGADPSVELASLGRRSAEMQLEALRLIEQYGF